MANGLITNGVGPGSSRIKLLTNGLGAENGENVVRPPTRKRVRPEPRFKVMPRNRGSRTRRVFR
jgi:hypothetical protein